MCCSLPQKTQVVTTAEKQYCEDIQFNCKSLTNEANGKQSTIITVVENLQVLQ